MTLLFDDTKKLEKAIGEEATRAVLSIVENAKSEAATGTATKADLADVRTDIAKLDGKIDKLAMQVKLLIVLALIAIAMFSPNLAALVKLSR